MMSGERGARDRRFEPVEGDGASGAAAVPFDGNYSNDIDTWLVANDSLQNGFPAWDDETFVMSTLPKLMYYTALGHLSWVVFPRQGFRL